MNKQIIYCKEIELDEHIGNGLISFSGMNCDDVEFNLVAKWLQLKIVDNEIRVEGVFEYEEF